LTTERIAEVRDQAKRLQHWEITVGELMELLDAAERIEKTDRALRFAAELLGEFAPACDSDRWLQIIQEVEK
jgi:hypothetical protein